MICALLAGYARGKGPRSRFHEVFYATSIAVSVYMVADLEFPRRGLLSAGDFDVFLRQLLGSMN